MSQRITIDPVTRIEGHLRIIAKSKMASVPKHGLPVPCGAAWKDIVKNRDPRDAWMIVNDPWRMYYHSRAVFRSCGKVLNIDVPVNAQYIRNIILGCAHHA
ncbi:nickel-dependent hydrogenase large subunit [Shigella flexneri]